MSAEDGADALDSMNMLLDQYAAQRLQIYSVTRTETAITSNVGTYTVGSGADINIARPVYIEHVNYQDTSLTPETEYQLDYLTDDAYARLPQKDLTSTVPSNWYYNPTFPDGTLILWPTPTSSTLESVVYAATAVAEFAALTDSLSLPPGYRRMLIKNLALDLAPGYGREISQALAIDAAESLQAVKAANLRMSDLSIDAGALGSARRYYWDIRTGP